MFKFIYLNLNLFNFIRNQRMNPGGMTVIQLNQYNTFNFNGQFMGMTQDTKYLSSDILGSQVGSGSNSGSGSGSGGSIQNKNQFDTINNQLYTDPKIQNIM